MLCFPLFAIAQTTPYDEISYELLITEQWEELLQVSKKALNEGYTFDYFYMRAGYACFQLKQYMHSAIYYEKALEHCKDSSQICGIRYYLYWNSIYTGNYTHAVKEYEIISRDNINKNLVPAPKLFHLVGAEFGMKFSNNEDLYKTLYYTQIGVGFKTGNKVTGFVSIAHINQEAYYGTLNQEQIYLAANIPLKKQWLITPAFHFINYKHHNMKLELSENDFQDMPILGSISLTKRFYNWKTSIASSFSNFNKANQFQQQLILGYYLFSNNKFETAVILTHLHSNGSNSLLYGTQLKYWALDKLALSGNYLFANSSHFNEQNGWIATNAFDKTFYKIQLGTDYMLFNNLYLYGIWQLEERQESYSKNNYNLNMALLGLKLIR
jgi:hypothetical protein